MDEYEVSCSECGEETVVYSYDTPEFCSLCGRRVEPNLTDEQIEKAFKYED